MKKLLATAVLIIASQAATSHAGVDVDVHIGTPPVIVAPPPPVPGPPQVVIEGQPSFIFSPFLGFYVSVGIPYDIVYIGQSYYLYRGGYWFVSPSYRGPWVVAQRRRLPPGLRKYRYEQIRHYRDEEYRAYTRDRDHYRGRWHRPEVERREHGREEHRGR